MTAVLRRIRDGLRQPGAAPRDVPRADDPAGRLVIVVTLLLVFTMAARAPVDLDLWWHLRAGEETLRSGRPLLVDLFTFTRQGAPWINHSWLSQVGMALLYGWGGALALGGAVALLATLSMGLAAGQCEAPAPLKALALLLGSIVASTVWTPRPQLLSLVMLALTGWLLYAYKYRGRDRLWALPLLFVLWSNLHGGYPLGLLLIGALLAGEALNHLLGLAPHTALRWQEMARLVGWTVLAAVAVLANPNGLDTWRIPFQTVKITALQAAIPEWASPDFHVPLQQSLIWLLLAVFMAVALSGRKMDGADLVTVLVFGYSALVARRNYGPFAVVAVPVLARYGALAVEQAREWWIRRAADRASHPLHASSQPAGAAPNRGKKAINLALVALIALVGLGKLVIVTHPAVIGASAGGVYPAQVADFLAAHPPGMRIFNEYDWGGYLEWRLPGSTFYIDGRTDLFGDALIGEWMGLVQGETGWQATLDAYQVDLVVLRPDRPLLRALPTAGWRLLYQDPQAVVYRRR